MKIRNWLWNHIGSGWSIQSECVSPGCTSSSSWAWAEAGPAVGGAGPTPTARATARARARATARARAPELAESDDRVKAQSWQCVSQVGSELLNELSRWKQTRLFDRSNGQRPGTGRRPLPLLLPDASPCPIPPVEWPAGSSVRFTWACLAAILESMKLCGGWSLGRWVSGLVGW